MFGGFHRPISGVLARFDRSGSREWPACCPFQLVVGVRVAGRRVRSGFVRACPQLAAFTRRHHESSRAGMGHWI